MRKKLVLLSCGVFLLLAVAVVGDWQPILGSDITTHTYTGPTARQSSGQGIPGGRDVVYDNGMLYDGLGASQYDDVNALDPILADDFEFTVDQAVNDVHWIGGYWNGPPDDGDFDWEIKFYNDDGTGTAPGTEIGTYNYSNSDVNETWIDGTPGGSNFYSYSVVLPATLTFSATTKYWISIQGIGVYPPQSGWAYHQDPIVLHEAVFKSVYFGYPNWTNSSTVFGYAVDMCFQLTYEEVCSWNVGDPHKMHYPQLPDEDGWDVNATYPYVLAEDWQCSDSDYVEDIHFWGSWRFDDIGEILYFQIAIHSNIPQGPDGYSIPANDFLWQFEIPIEWVNIVPIQLPTPLEGWYDPFSGDVLYNDHSWYFQYNICLYDWIDTLQMFYQYKDEIYWLEITAIIADPASTQWGWKSSEDHFMDDGVFADLSQGRLWQELYEPGTSPDPITNSFWVELDATGAVIPPTSGGTDYYDDGTSINGWFFYPNTGWWNIWFYDHPFDPTRYKEIYVQFDWFPTTEPYWLEMAVNWATPDWPPGLPPPVPPLDPVEEDQVIWREYLPIGPPGPQEFYITVPDYNPEWISIDVMGQNIIIPQGIAIHECLPQQDTVSMDLAFVITGGPECSPSVVVSKLVRDPATGGFVELADVHAGDEAEFLIEIYNNGTCCDLTNIVVVDTLDDSFEFTVATPYPDVINAIPEGTELIWNFPGPLPVGGVITINLFAEVLGPVCHTDTNYVFVEVYCDATGEYAYGADEAYVHATQPPTDFGDLPDSYQTLLASDGARHTIVPNIFLGLLIDPEADGQPSANALGDDTDALGDDEDGVVFTTLLVQGQVATVKVTASVAGRLNAWADWNGNGLFDAGEQIFVDQPLVAGPNFLPVPVPAASIVGTTYSRFRFNTAGGLNFFGPATDGEVEDYRLFILSPIEDVKMHWEQLPDLDNTGMDVDLNDFEPQWAARGDDFLCTETGAITDVHFWLSFMEDVLPPGGPEALTFQLEIWTNIPPGVPPYDYSHPGEPICGWIFSPGSYQVTQVADNNPEDWYSPLYEAWVNDNHLNCYQYDFYITDETCIQTKDSIYWLVVYDITPLPHAYEVGWKTTTIDLRFMDDAVALIDPPATWIPMFYPPGHEFAFETLDLAFVITGRPTYVCGDANGDGTVDIDDAVYLIAYIFSGGPPPVPYAAGDVNCDGVVDIDDVVYLIAYIFSGGPAPCDPNGDGVPDC